MPPEHHCVPRPVLATKDADQMQPLDALRGLTGLWVGEQGGGLDRHGDKGVLGVAQ